MMDYWLKQTHDKPLFPELLWSRPENKRQAGKLAIIGGNQYGFAAVAEAYKFATEAGIGAARVLLPESLRKTVGPIMLEAEFAASNPSGSFSQKALMEFLDIAAWANGVLLAGDLGRNSETAIVLEKFVTKYNDSLVITKDAVDYFTAKPDLIIDRPQTTLVLSLSQLQKLFTNARTIKPIVFSMDILRLVEALHDFTNEHSLEIVVKHLDALFVAASGRVSTTKLSEEIEVWRVSTAARAAVWRLQNSAKSFEALSTAIVSI